MGVPSVQASYMKNSAAILARCGADGAAVLRADPELFEQIEAAWRTAWLPISFNLRLAEACARAIAPERQLELFATMLVEQFESPLWNTLVRGGLRLLGREPGALTRWLPAAVALVFRNCGSWSAQRIDPLRAEVSAEELPKELATHRVWLESMGAAAVAIGHLCDTQGRSELVARDAEAGRARLAFSWDPIAPAARQAA
jgi:hypothetical protein